jgi:tight adherence protein C
MSSVLLASILIITIPVSVLTYLAITADLTSRKIVRRNLADGPAAAAKPGQTQTIHVQLADLAKRVTPAGYAGWLDKKLTLAGRPASLPLERLLVVKPLLALGAGAIGLLVVLANPAPTVLVVVLAIVVLMYFVPDVLLDSRGQTRQKAIQLELPNTLDQMLIAVEAGLGFESAMARAAGNGRGPIADELTRTLQDIRMGRNRKEAYLQLMDRTSVQELRSFVRAVIQADKYGIAVARVLRSQAAEMRVKRRQRAEEQAMKVPVKILFPLIFTILPVLFIVLLSPAVLSIAKLFSSGGF